MARRSVPVLLFLATLIVAGACGPARPEPTPEVVAFTLPSLPTGPDDPVWDEVPPHIAPLLPQDVVEPRLLEASTTEVHVRAITDGVRVAFRLDWADALADDLPGPGRFADACAIQMPVAIQPDVPDPHGAAGCGG